MLRQYLKGMLVVVLLLPAAAHATLIKDNELIFDITSGLYWVPVEPFTGALVPGDLPPRERYARTDEVNALFGRYVRVFEPVCSFSQGPCDPTASRRS